MGQNCNNSKPTKLRELIYFNHAILHPKILKILTFLEPNCHNNKHNNYWVLIPINQTTLRLRDSNLIIMSKPPNQELNNNKPTKLRVLISFNQTTQHPKINSSIIYLGKNCNNSKQTKLRVIIYFLQTKFPLNIHKLDLSFHPNQNNSNRIKLRFPVSFNQTTLQPRSH